MGTVGLWAVDVPHFSFLVHVYIDTVAISAASTTAGTVPSDRCPKSILMAYAPFSFILPCQRLIWDLQFILQERCIALQGFCESPFFCCLFLSYIILTWIFSLSSPAYNLCQEWLLGCVASSAMSLLQVSSCLCYISLKNICIAGVCTFSERQESDMIHENSSSLTLSLHLMSGEGR